MRSSIPRRAAFLALILLGLATPVLGQEKWKHVSFRGVSVRVPSDWPVYNLGREPTRCVRFDVHAVYLGAEGPDVMCPARLVGKTEAIHLQPWADDRRGLARARPMNGEATLVDPRGAEDGNVVMVFPRPRISALITFGSDRSLAEEIASSIDASGADDAPSSSAGLPGLPGFEAAATSTQPTALQPGRFVGEGFDTCANPPLERMEAWLASPYRAIAIYIGGINRGCSQTLSTSWVSSVARMGWSLIPTYVGLQAPCSSYSNRIDPARAASQGRSAATDAIADADAIGLPTGSPVYVDMEAFSYSNTACRVAVLRFLSGWATRMQDRGYLAGVYGSASSTMRALASVYNDPTYRRPDAIWNARWGAQEHTVWDEPEIPNTFWANHQRIHQYRGGHHERWGGVTINIDNDFLDGPVVRRLAVPRWISGDVSGDGKTDLVHLCCRDYLNTWFSNGDGTYAIHSFRPWSGYGLQLGTWLTADVSGDGRDDLIHLCCSDSANIWISNGDGTYTITIFRPWRGYGIRAGSWRTGDFNGDGRVDLVHLCCKDYAHIWLSRGDGTFTVSVFSAWSGYGFSIGSWQAGDLDGDGDGDLIHLCCAESANIWLSQGDGTFTATSFRPWTGYGLQLGTWLAADVSGDGRDDLVHLCCSESANTWISNGNGSYAVSLFRPWAGYALRSGSWLVSDPNGDARNDLVHLCCGDSPNTWTSNGDGTYVVAQYQPWPGYSIRSGSWQSGDLNGDGLGDLVHLCCNAVLNTWLSQSDGTYEIIASPI